TEQSCSISCDSSHVPSFPPSSSSDSRRRRAPLIRQRNEAKSPDGSSRRRIGRCGGSRGRRSREASCFDHRHLDRFQLVEDQDSLFPKGVPWVRYHGTYKDLKINLIWPGKDPSSGVDSVGTISASLVTYASIQALQPDLIINAGTAGGFKAKGASISDVFLASEVAFHDRRIPIP
ncbi:hypothetical protein EUGRSUZ_L03396, partial [Eucalyptus grandis]